ncbi:MAG: histidine kinase [Verrucomicrobiales bacterium]|nr:histidine kinase [Verrucomicrobiales bacterium]
MNRRIRDHFLHTRSGRIALWFAAFALLASVEAIQMRAGQRFEEFTVTWGTALRRGFEAWMPAAVLGLGVLGLADRCPFDRQRPGRWIALHLVSCVVYTLAFAVSHAALLTGQTSVRGKVFEFGPLLGKILIFYTVTNLGFYWLVVLGHHGWRYYQQFRERERRAIELEGQLATAQLEVLRMQLNPHFLFNTLNTVAALVHEQPHTAERMVTRLSELLRAGLDSPHAQEATLREELRLLERFLDIEQVRFSDRLRIEIEAPEELLDLQVPTLIFQPLVENAIRHGIEPLEAHGHIRVSARRENERLILSVEDNGPGPSKAPGSCTRRGGIGLSNTRSRLRHLYGDDQSLELIARKGGGTEARVSVPVRQNQTVRFSNGNPAVLERLES